MCRSVALTCRHRRDRRDDDHEIVLLLRAQIACAPPSVIAYHDHFAHIEAGDAFDPPLLEELAPAADRVVVKEQRMGGLLTTPPVVQKHHGVRAARHATRRRTAARARSAWPAIFLARKAVLNHARRPNPPDPKTQEFSPRSSTSRETANSRFGNRSGKNPGAKSYAPSSASMAAISASHTSTPSTRARPLYHQMVRRRLVLVI
jgi:hypothetical protein